MKKIIQTIKEKANGLRLKQRMMLIYVIGCILPILILYCFMYANTSSLLLEQAQENEQESLHKDVNDINATVALIEELSSNFSYDVYRQVIGLRKYASKDILYADNKNWSKLEDYLSKYYPDVSDVSMYVFEGKIDNHHFKLITDTIMTKKWYINTLAKDGMPYWSYFTDVGSGKRRLRLTRAMFDNRGNMIGILSLGIDSSISDVITDRNEAIALFVYEDDTLMNSNMSLNNDELETIMSKVTDEKFDGSIIFNHEKYMVTIEKVQPRYGAEFYYAIILNSYNMLTSRANRSTQSGLIPLMLGIFVSTVAVWFLSGWISKRIEGFSRVMHAAAKGNFYEKNLELGNVKDEIWDLNEDLNQMIQDIRKLMDDVVKQKVQKEQMYSRQRDVEFKMLATQINPHFLYNTLENIRMLARINKQPEIEDISVTLTKLLRRSLNAGKNNETLLWEMEMVEYYIKIQNYRFGDRITASVSYDKELASKYMVIPLVVQPFVENAYVHAMEEKESDGHISVCVEINEILTIVVEDNGQGMSEEYLKEITKYINDFDNLDRTHIGICNVNQRIKLKYGNSFGVDFESKENVGTRVRITMPLVENT